MLVKRNLRLHSVCVHDLPFEHGNISLNHLFDKVGERSLGHPSNDVLRLGRVSQQQLDFGGPEVSRVNLDQDTRLVGGVDTDLVNSSCWSGPLDCSSDNSECFLDELSDTDGEEENKKLDDVHVVWEIIICTYDLLDSRVRFARGKDVIIWLIHLKHHPHALNIVAGMAPITLGINVT